MPSSAMSDAWWDVGPCGMGGPPECALRCPEASAGPPVPAPAPAQLLITAAPPFNIVNVTDGWCRLTGFSAEAVFGRPVGLLHGPLTCPETLAALTIAMSLGRSLRVMLVSYTVNGEPFLNCVDSRPVLDAAGAPAVFQWEIIPKSAALSPPAQPPAAAPMPASAPSAAANLSPFGLPPLPDPSEEPGCSPQPGLAASPPPEEGQFSDLCSDMSSLSRLSSAEADGPTGADRPPAASPSAGGASPPELSAPRASSPPDSLAHGPTSFAAANQLYEDLGHTRRRCGSQLGGSQLGGSQLGGSHLGGSQLGLSDLLESESGIPCPSAGLSLPCEPASAVSQWALSSSMDGVMGFSSRVTGLRPAPTSNPLAAPLLGRGLHSLGPAGLGGRGLPGAAFPRVHGPGLHGFGIDAGSLCALALGAPPLSLATAVAQALAIPAGAPADRPRTGDRRPRASAAGPPHDADKDHLPGIGAAYRYGGMLPVARHGGAPAPSFGAPAVSMAGQYASAAPARGIPAGVPGFTYQAYHPGSAACSPAAAATHPSSTAPAGAPAAPGKRDLPEPLDSWNPHAGDGRRTRRKLGPRAAPFVQKLFRMVSSPESDMAICWSEAGDTFWVRRPDLMEAVVLPQHFKHNRLSFFAKQLRAYGFKQRMAPSCLEMVREWHHASGNFYRGGAEQLPHIQRGGGGGAPPPAPPAGRPPPLGAQGRAAGGAGRVACKVESGDSAGDGSHGGSSDALSNPDSDSNDGSDSCGSHGKNSDNSGQESNSTLLSTDSKVSSLGSSATTDPSGTTAPVPSVPSPAEETTSGSGDGSDPDSSRSVSPSALQEQVTALNARVESHRATLSQQRVLILSCLEGIAASLRAKGLTPSGSGTSPCGHRPAAASATCFTARPAA